MEKSQKIDFVISWVDGGDPEWQAEKDRYANPGKRTVKSDSSQTRYRDWDNLRYWFRGVEKYAPWVNKIHFVTCGHVPEWLNLEAPKLNHVKHSDYIPEQYLPTFSSHPIELNLHRIKGLSEQFVYFCDDFFLTSPVEKKDFFVNGLPCDSLEESPLSFSYVTPMNNVHMNDVLFTGMHFDRKKCRKDNMKKWFNPKDPHAFVKNAMFCLLNDSGCFGFNVHHLPQAYKKSTLKEVWKANSEWLDLASSHKFRDAGDVSQCVFKFWQLCSGNFYPYNKRKFGRVFRSELEMDALCDAIRTSKYKTICINDADEIDFEMAKKQVNEAFESVFSEKSAFEL